MSQYNNTHGSTDVVFQKFSVFIEGVQVPFEAISISTNVGSLPSASIQVPIQAGLMDITRYYQPKIHIFFEDPITGKDCVLFTGVITSVTYNKSVRGGGSASISFACSHKYSLMEDLTLDFSGYTSDTAAQQTAPDAASPVGKMNVYNSMLSIGLAMSGIKLGTTALEVNPYVPASYTAVKAGTADPSILRDKWVPYYNRLKGMPGVLMSYWNQLILTGMEDPVRYDSLLKLYGPLVEQGLQFFDRLSGHYYIESMIDADKIELCPGKNSSENSDKKLVPPGHRLFLRSSIQAELSIRLLESIGQFSGELTNLLGIFQEFVSTIDYDIVTLTSPAEVPKDPSSTSKTADTFAVDTIIKPQLPFYYSPACNVVLPNMYTDLNVSQNEAAIPTRISMSQDLASGTGTMPLNYRAPPSFREAIAQGSKDYGQGHEYDLRSTLTGVFGKIGIYEQGRGVKQRMFIMPMWISLYAQSMDDKTDINSVLPAKGTQEDNWLDVIREAWKDRYNSTTVVKKDGTLVTTVIDKSALNPWSPGDSHINSFERILFATAEYRYTMEVAAAKAGSVEMIFNPYIIPGYPMDIIAASPVEPSFHAMCSSVTHSISTRSIGTSVGFVGAITYTELANYYLQFIHPWLQSALGVINQVAPDPLNNQTGGYHTTIVNNSEAASIANDFYKPTLGVVARAPEDLLDFGTGAAKPIGSFSMFSVKTPKGAERNPNLTAMGNLGLAYRPIETRDSLETRMGLKFIDMSPGNYNPTVIQYTDSVLTNSSLLEPGASQFLDYAPVPKTP